MYVPQSNLPVNQAELIDLAKFRSDLVFGPCEDHGRPYCPESNCEYFYFPAVHYFEAGIITHDLIENLQNGGKMLTIGSGDAHLERLLSSGFGVAQQNMDVSDISLDPTLLDSGFSSYEFDMCGTWPKFDSKYDYVVFPESLGVALMHTGGSETTHCFREWVDQDVSKILSGDLSKDYSFFNDLMERDCPVVKHITSVLGKALDNTKDDGQIRVCYGISNDQQRAYVINNLSKFYERLEFSFVDRFSTFKISKR